MCAPGGKKTKRKKTTFSDRPNHCTFRTAPTLKAVAHKLARACYYMIKEDVAFDVTRAFG